MYSLNQSVIHCINFYLSNISSKTIPICSHHIYSALDQVLCIAYSSTMFPFQSAVNIASNTYLAINTSWITSIHSSNVILCCFRNNIHTPEHNILQGGLNLHFQLQYLPKTQCSSLIKTLITPKHAKTCHKFIFHSYCFLCLEYTPPYLLNF